MSLSTFPSHLFDNEVGVTRDGGVVTITINRPKVMNTMSPGTIAGVMVALEMCADDTSVAVVVFTGAGDRAFCAGGNLEGGGASSGMRGKVCADEPPPTVMGAVRSLRHSMISSQLLRDSHFVSICAVNGACAGAGLSWACACDVRIAAENALFRAGFLTAGLGGDFGGTWLLPRIVGSAKARELYLLDPKVKAAEAVQIGLASLIIPLRGEAFQAAVHQMALEMSARPPLALKRIKANLVDADRLTFSEHLDIEAERHAKSGYHPDAAEAGAAFMEKRAPQFTGAGILSDRQPWEMSKI